MPPRQLLESIRAQGFAGEALPVVTLEEFFEGNADLGSIGCNLSKHPGVATFFSVLRDIRNRSEVQDVLVGITEDMGDEDWPFSDTVYVLTAGTLEQVAGWAEPLQPDPTEAYGWIPAEPARAPALLPAHRVVTLWWD